MELADLVIINKADLDAEAATRAQAQITSALRFLGPHTTMNAQVLKMSALHGSGIDAVWQAVTRFRERQRNAGRFEQRRHEQNQTWMWERIEAGLKQRFRDHPAVAAALPGIVVEVKSGRLAASAAARRLLDLTD
jgi:LAO/AO transport system kinase